MLAQRTLFWVIAALDTVALLLLLLDVLWREGGGDSGGRAMTIMFAIIVPAVLLCVTCFTYALTSSASVRTAALIVAAAPVAIVALAQIRGGLLSQSVRDLQSGRGYFEASADRDLAAAIVSNDLEAVRIAARRADLNAEGSSEATFLKLAMGWSSNDRPRPDIVRFLLEHGADPNGDYGGALAAAIRSGDEELVILFLAHGADPNVVPPYGAPVYFAAVEQPRMLLVLLDRGAKIDAVDDVGNSALMIALRSKQWAAAEMLLARGADPRHRRKDGESVADVLKSIAGEMAASGETIPSGLPRLADARRALAAKTPT